MANRQYLTPPDIPDDVYCRVLRIPNSAQWIGTLTGVLYPLCFASAWTDEDGGITPEQAAERFTQLFNEYLESDGICDMGMFDVRQSATDPCILEKTEDGGLAWQPFAMLNLCASLQPRPDTKLPSLIRHNDVTGKIEYSLDGGETWVEAIPPATPETNPWTPPRIPAEGATDALKRCNAANRAVGNLSDMYRQTYGAVSAGIANTLTDFSKFVAELADVVFGVVYGYWYTIPDLLLDYWFGPEVYNYYTAPELPLAAQEDLLCLLYQYASVSGDGVVSFDFGAVRDNVIDVLGINPGIAVWSHLNYLGEAGLNRLGDIGFGAGLSCASCDDFPPGDWKLVYDLTASSAGWVIPISGRGGTWSAGQGIVPTIYYQSIYGASGYRPVTIVSANGLTNVRFEWTGVGYAEWQVKVSRPDNPDLVNIGFGAGTPGPHATYPVTGEIDAIGVDIFAIASGARVVRAEIWGTGIFPPGAVER